MKPKNHRPLPSQVLGIIWLSVGLLLVVAVAFFSRKVAPKPPENAPAEVSGRQILEHREDSVYRQRNKHTHYQYTNTKKQVTAPLRSDTVRRPAIPPPARRQPLMVELNSADTTTLMLLHGIGPVYASRIVRYRERLGGFRSADQLLEVYGFTPELLDHIAPCLSIDTAALRRIEINTVELKQLLRHPYIEYYQARDIVRLRGKGIVFRSADDLRAVPSMADSTLDRLLPYLDFGL